MTHRIETERLILRPFTLDDIEPSYQMNLDPEVTKYTGDGGVVSREAIDYRIKTHVFGDYQKHGFGRFAVELKETGNFIGFAGLKFLPEMNEVDIGYRFMQEHWGKGYATESGKASLAFGFEELKLNRIIGIAMPENTASVHVLKKLGLTFEKEMMEDGDLVCIYSIRKP